MIIVTLLFVCAFVGAGLGARSGNALGGFMAGILLGPFGVLIMLFGGESPDRSKPLTSPSDKAQGGAEETLRPVVTGKPPLTVSPLPPAPAQARSPIVEPVRIMSDKRKGDDTPLSTHLGCYPVLSEFRSYDVFCEAVRPFTVMPNPAVTLSRAFRNEPTVRAAKSKLMSEVVSIYSSAAVRLSIPNVELHISARMKTIAKGRAVSVNRMPKKIILFPISGPTHRPYSEWTSSDIKLHTKASFCETFLHEVAHIYELHHLSSFGHGPNFVEAYLRVEEVFIELGMGRNMLVGERFTGCPRGSVAAACAKSPRKSEIII
jgi:hypothetical protein